MLGIPRRFSHFVFGFIEPGPACNANVFVRRSDNPGRAWLLAE